MGNDLNFTKSCIEVDGLCTQQFNSQQPGDQQISLRTKKATSTDQIKQKIIKYIEKNRLQLYSVREKKLLQSLVSVNQEHVSDTIIQLDKKIKFHEQEKRQLSRNISKLANRQKATSDETELQEMKEKEAKLAQQIRITKQKRKTIFEEAQCILLQDLDMIFQNIPYFDHNYHIVNNIINLSQGLTAQFGNKQSKMSQNQKQQPIEETIQNRNQNTEKSTRLQNISKKQTDAQKQSSLKNKLFSSINQKKERRIEETLKKTVLLQEKKPLKQDSKITLLGNEVLQSNNLLIIIPIQCFSAIGALRNNTQTGLPSGASLLQVLTHKIKAVNMRRSCVLGIAFLVNQNYTSDFNKAISQVKGLQKYVNFDKLQMNSTFSNHQSEQGSQHPLYYSLVPFKNIWPSFDSSQKILLKPEDSGIMFSTTDGDLIGFIENSIQLKQLINKYKYVNITNVNNILSQIGDAYLLGYMEQKEQIDIAVKLLKPKQKDYELKDYLVLDDKGFIELGQNQNKQGARLISQNQTSAQSKQYQQNRAFLNIQEYYIKSRIFTTQSGPLKRLLMSRVVRQQNSDPESQKKQFYLHRSITSILYCKFTAFILVDEDYEFSHVRTSPQQFPTHLYKNGQIGYSRYCKKLLGLKPSQQTKEAEEIVQIDAGILHKGSEQLMKILKQLKKVKQIGFPVILYSDFFNSTNKEG